MFLREYSYRKLIARTNAVLLVQCSHANTRIDTVLDLRPADELVPAAFSAICPKCGTTKKFGKGSCCARGGAWFKRCGDAGDPTKDHTWADGMEACNGLASSNPVKSMILLTVEQATNTIVLSNSTQNQKNMRRHRSHDGTTNSEESVALAKVAVRTCVLSIILRLQL